MRRNLLAWQWADYSAKHRNRTNLLLHIFAVPLFQIGSILLFYAIYLRSIKIVIAAVISMLLSLIIQGRGHKLESETPAPFSGALDLPSRLIAEQWITFPRFLLSGGWYRNYKTDNAR
jgi:phage terminase small subunit